ncbi:MFS transporter [Zafaria sp. J156]|uniref:MFS transporter n=1 Tax=Zafaria sp. J156 TaxID=3116490 RepID=UPI002E792187|nr:MFS transporter [Zafaria sp. J156]MEE1621686.1 MFS transporter [Zafaria sp. J156]
MPRSVPPSTRARLGVSLMFFTNGVLFSALLPRLPEIKDAFGLSNAQFGLSVIAFPVGAILAAAWAAPLIRRFGAPLVVQAGSVLLAAAVACAGAGPTVWVFVAALVLGGTIDAIVDAAQNVHGVAVERWHGRSILNSLHAAWSIGAATGGLIGAVCAAQGVPIGTQMIVNGAVWALAAVYSGVLSRIPASVPGRTPDAAAAGAAGGAEKAGSGVVPPPGPGAARAGTGRYAAARLLAPLVVLAICGILVEDVGNNWAVLFLHTETTAAPALAGLGLTVLISAQFVGRILGDPMTDRWGRGNVARFGGLLIAAGGLVVVFGPGPLGAMAGFALAGFGCATLVPAAFAAADAVPGLPAGTGIAMLGWLMRLGFLVTSPAIGLISDATSLRTAFLVLVAGGLGAAAIAHAKLRRPAVPAR